MVIDGTSHLVANNLCWDNLERGIQLLSSDNNKIYNNTCYNNGGAGISVDGGLNNQLTNNILWQNSTPIADTGTGTTETTNLSTSHISCQPAAATEHVTASKLLNRIIKRSSTVTMAGIFTRCPVVTPLNPVSVIDSTTGNGIR